VLKQVIYQSRNTDSADNDVTPADQPISVNGNLPSSWQRSHDSGVCRRCDGGKSEERQCSIVAKMEPTDINNPLESADLKQRCCLSSLAAAAADDNDKPQPLDLTRRLTSMSSSGADADLTESQTATSQILLLNGQRYEILPVGDGRWMSRGEYQLMSMMPCNGLSTTSDGGGDDDQSTTATAMCDRVALRLDEARDNDDVKSV